MKLAYFASLALIVGGLAACSGPDTKADEPAGPIDETGSIDESAAYPELPTVEIPYETFKLDNGLTVVVHEDRKVPVVAVNAGVRTHS